MADLTISISNSATVAHAMPVEYIKKFPVSSAPSVHPAVSVRIEINERADAVTVCPKSWPWLSFTTSASPTLSVSVNCIPEIYFIVDVASLECEDCC